MSTIIICTRDRFAQVRAARYASLHAIVPDDRPSDPEPDDDDIERMAAYYEALAWGQSAYESDALDHGYR